MKNLFYHPFICNFMEVAVKKKFFIFTSFFFLMFLAQINANCISEERNFETLLQKIYLHTQQIIFDDTKIFVQLNDNDIIAVPAIFSDQQGYYILKTWGCKSWEWKCPNTSCGRCNSLEYYRCPSCGTEMPD